MHRVHSFSFERGKCSNGEETIPKTEGFRRSHRFNGNRGGAGVSCACWSSLSGQILARTGISNCVCCSSSSITRVVIKSQALTTSDDLTGRCCYQTDAAMTYMRSTNQYIQELLTPYVVGAVGRKEYQKMRNAFRAAALDAEEEDCMGFHTGQAICYNEVVLQHVDKEDSGYCVIFCVGSHRGGFLYLPDGNLTF